MTGSSTASPWISTSACFEFFCDVDESIDTATWSAMVPRSMVPMPVIRTTWEAGPFSHPVEPPRYVEEHDGGRVTMRSEGSRTRVVYGPWRDRHLGLVPVIEHGADAIVVLGALLPLPSDGGVALR